MLQKGKTEKCEWEQILAIITSALGHSGWLKMGLYCSVPNIRPP